jgi:E3 ubiquitin-protein ligase HUWE1
MPQHYLVLAPVIRRLAESAPVAQPDFPAGEFAQPALFGRLVSVSHDRFPVNRVLAEFARDEAALAAILAKITAAFPRPGTPPRHLLALLTGLSDLPGFPAIFAEKCAPAFFSLIPLSGFDVPTLAAARRLFPDMPAIFVQAAIFLLLSVPDPQVIALVAGFPPDSLSVLAPYVQLAFDRVSGASLAAYVQHFPFLVPRNRERLFSCLEELLSAFSRDSLPAIGVLLTALCPPRVSLPCRDLPGDSESGLTIPSALLERDPAFWRLVESHGELFDRLVDERGDLLLTDLRFLSLYPEVLRLGPRMRLFRGQQAGKLSGPLLQVTVSRGNVLSDSFTRLRAVTGKSLLAPFRVFFRDEPARDEGGVTRDWFSCLVRELFNPHYLLFAPSANGRSAQPNPSSYVEPRHMELFAFAGRVIARALVEGVCLDCHMTRALLKHILGVPMSLRDLEDVDERCHASLAWILANDVSGAGLTFAADYDDLGCHKTMALKEGGVAIDVTNENKEEYVRLMVEHRLTAQVAEQIKAFVDGFHELVAQEEIAMFGPDELDLLICGVPQIDVDDLLRNCEFIFPYAEDHPVIRMFAAVVRRFSSEEKAKLLLFVTGSSQVPVGGFRALGDFGTPVKIAPGGGSDRLPAAHTCNNQLDLPAYESEEEMNARLLFAVRECNSFGFT